MKTEEPLDEELYEELESVPEDDAIIGRAFKWSLVVMAGIAVVVLAILGLRGSDDEQDVVIDKEVGEIEDLVTDVDVLPNVRFTDVTQSAGIDFTHFNGARGEKLLPETMGGGAAFFDFDGDGDQDLLFVNGASWPHDADDGAAPGNALYENDGSGNFENVTQGSGLEGGFYGMGVAVGDYDGDGRVDVFMTGVGENHLFHNQGGRFVDVTAAAGVAGSADQWTTSAGFFDYDGDDDLDLFVCRYVRWSRAIDEQLSFTLNGVDRAYGPPTNYQGSFSTLYRNDGSGKFTDVSEQAGIHVTNSSTGEPMGKALGVSFSDFDGDGHIDIAVANDTVQNHLFHNQGDGTFEEIGFESGFGFDGNGGATGAMGIDIADYRNDGSLGVCIGNFANEMTSLYVAQDGALRFTDESMGEGIGSPSRLRLTFGLFFLDYDLDGRQDLLQVNGHLEETINEVQVSQEYLQPPQLFWNAGPSRRSCFMEVPSDTIGDLALRLAARGSCMADIDGDGDQDVLLIQVGNRPYLLRNDQELENSWLRVRLEGSGKNRDAIGSWVVVRTGNQELRRQVMPSRSYLSQSELPLTLGLGKAPSVQAIEIIWPDGTVQAVPVPESFDRELVVQRAG